MPTAMNTLLSGLNPDPRGFCGTDDVAVGMDAGLSGEGESSFEENNRGVRGFFAGFGRGAAATGAGAGAGSGITTSSGGLS